MTNFVAQVLGKPGLLGQTFVHLIQGELGHRPGRPMVGQTPISGIYVMTLSLRWMRSKAQRP